MTLKYTQYLNQMNLYKIRKQFDLMCQLNAAIFIPVSHTITIQANHFDTIQWSRYQQHAVHSTNQVLRECMFLIRCTNMYVLQSGTITRSTQISYNKTNLFENFPRNHIKKVTSSLAKHPLLRHFFQTPSPLR